MAQTRANAPVPTRPLANAGTRSAELPRPFEGPAQPLSAPGVSSAASATPVTSVQPKPAATLVEEAKPEPQKAAPIPQQYSPPENSSPIAGPSFLGLNTPAAWPRETRAETFANSNSRQDADRLHRGDSFHQPSQDLGYLLQDEDEEEPKRGWGKWVLVALVLAATVGIGYMRYNHLGLDWLTGGEKKLPGTSDSGQSGVDGGNSGAAGAPVSASPAGTASGAGGASPEPATSGAAPSASDPSENGVAKSPGVTNSPGIDSTATNAPPSGAAPDSANPSSTQPAPLSSGAPNAAAAQVPAAAGSDDKAAQTAASQSSANPPSSSPTQNNQASPNPPPESATADGAEAAPAPVAAKGRTLKPSAAKPSAAKPAAAKPYDSVGEAERYIYGRGVAQDCDLGLRLLKPAAQQADAKAMISLGSLYSSGTCTPHDLPTAYRWYALALHKQPDNAVLQDDLQKLWSKMTPPERQLAIKLSQ